MKMIISTMPMRVQMICLRNSGASGLKCVALYTNMQPTVAMRIAVVSKLTSRRERVRSTDTVASCQLPVAVSTGNREPGTGNYYRFGGSSL